MNNTAIKTLDCPGRITRFYHWMHCQKRYNEKKKHNVQKVATRKTRIREAQQQKGNIKKKKKIKGMKQTLNDVNSK